MTTPTIALTEYLHNLGLDEDQLSQDFFWRPKGNLALDLTRKIITPSCASSATTRSSLFNEACRTAMKRFYTILLNQIMQSYTNRLYGYIQYTILLMKIQVPARRSLWHKNTSGRTCDGWTGVRRKDAMPADVIIIHLPAFELEGTH